MRKLKFKEQMAINRATTSKEQMFIARQENDEKARLFEILMTNEADFKEELRNLMYADDPETKAKIEEKYIKQKEKAEIKAEKIEIKAEKVETQAEKAEDKTEKFFAKQGMPNPSDTTRKAFEKQKISVSENKFLNFMETASLSFEAQANANFHDTQLKQNFISIAQQDEIIKQNDEIISQNDRMIELMEMMVNK